MELQKSGTEDNSEDAYENMITKKGHQKEYIIYITYYILNQRTAGSRQSITRYFKLLNQYEGGKKSRKASRKPKKKSHKKRPPTKKNIKKNKKKRTCKH